MDNMGDPRGKECIFCPGKKQYNTLTKKETIKFNA